MIRAYLGDGSRFGVSITYSQEERLLGSAGAVKRLEQFFDDSFFVLYGDVLTDVDLSALASFHREKGAGLTMAIYQAEDPTRCGIVEIDEDGRAERFLEKPKRREVFSPWANAGVYVAEPDILRFIPGNSFFDFGADLIPILLQEGTPVCGYVSPSYFLDIGSLDRYQQAERDFAAGLVELGQSTSSVGSRKEKVASRR